MAVAEQPSNQHPPEMFRQIILANIHYWSQKELNALVPELPQVLRGLNFALSLPEAWLAVRDLVLRLSDVIQRYGQASSWIGILHQVIDQCPLQHEVTKIELHRTLGNLYRSRGQLAEAEHHYRKVLPLCTKYDQINTFWQLTSQLALVARIAGKPDEALAYCEQILAEKTLPKSIIVEALSVKGLVAYDRWQPVDALGYFDQALKLALTLDDPYNIARILTNRGLALRRSDNLDEAERSYQEALQYFEEAGDLIERNKPLTNLGNIYLMRKEYRKAVEYYETALPIFRQHHYLVELGHVNNNLGMAYTGLENWPLAEAYYAASFDTWQTLGDDYNQANAMDNFGEMLIKSNRHRHAQEILQQAQHILNRIPDNQRKSILAKDIKSHLAQLTL